MSGPVRSVEVALGPGIEPAASSTADLARWLDEAARSDPEFGSGGVAAGVQAQIWAERTREGSAEHHLAAARVAELQERWTGEGLYLGAHAFYRLGAPARALDALARVDGALPRRTEWRRWLLESACWAMLGEDESRLRAARRALDASIHNPDPLDRVIATVELAWDLLGTGSAGEAVETVQDLLERIASEDGVEIAGERLAEIAYLMTLGFERIGATAEGLEAAAEGLAFVPPPTLESFLLRARARLLTRAGRLDEAHDALTQAFLLCADDPNDRGGLHLEEARLHLAAGRRREAGVAGREAFLTLGATSEGVSALWTAVEALLELSELESSAESLIREALATRLPEREAFRAWLTLGSLLARQDRHDEAAGALQKALALAPGEEARGRAEAALRELRS